MKKNPASLSTGEVAYLCYVSIRSVAKWCDSGELPFHRLPTAHFKSQAHCARRKVMVKDLRLFLQERNFPLDRLDIYCRLHGL